MAANNVVILGFCLIVVAATFIYVVEGDEDYHECERECVVGDTRRCVYNWTLQWYPTRSKACYDCPFNMTDCYRPDCVPGDGYDRVFIATNKMMPGPKIEVCEGDTVVVAVTNHLEDGAGTTIHWHGMFQRGTPWMDGGYLVTQCPITHRATFVYEFIANPQGTHFWHGHTQMQRGDGLYGPMIVKQAPELEAHYDLLDHDCDSPSGDCEHNAIITDWFHEAATLHLMHEMHHGNFPIADVSALLNGKNSRVEVSNEEGQTGYTPYEQFNVQPGKRYRFRVTSASNDLVPWKVSVEGHDLVIIAADGQPVKPLDVGTFMIYPGERYDFILEANQPVDNYWFKFHGVVLGRGNYALGVIHYEGAPEVEPSGDPSLDAEGVLLNPVFVDGEEAQLPPRYYHGDGLDVLASELSYFYEQDWSDEVVDITYYMGMDFELNDQDRFNDREHYSLEDMIALGRSSFSPLLDNITTILPPSPPLTQPNDFDPSTACNRESIDMDHCHNEGCACTHLIAFPLGAVVDLVIVNEAAVFMAGSHPMHLHGYDFRVMGMGQLGRSTTVAEVQSLYEAGLLPIKYLSPSHRDTIQIMDGGYAILRFYADNPGYWYFHCHVENHVEIGQAAVLQVGEPADFAPTPQGFPTCGNFNL